jgi:hypothetical protein
VRIRQLTCLECNGSGRIGNQRCLTCSRGKIPFPTDRLGEQILRQWAWLAFSGQDYIRLGRELRGALFPRNAPTSPPVPATALYEAAVARLLLGYGFRNEDLFDVFGELSLSSPVDQSDRRERLALYRDYWSTLDVVTRERDGVPPPLPHLTSQGERQSLAHRRKRETTPLRPGSPSWEAYFAAALAQLHSFPALRAAVDYLHYSRTAQRVLVEIYATRQPRR